MVIAFSLMLYQPVMSSLEVAGSARPPLAARLAPGTDALLQQTAAHLSRMQRGASIGGFPAFEPPDDKYRRKIENEAYTARDVNDWVGDINNFLRQIADKNPGLTLEEILQRHGATPGQIKEFLDALRAVQATTEGMEGYGVTTETAQTLKSLLELLGVSLWVY